MPRPNMKNIYQEQSDCYIIQVQYKNEYVPVYIDKEDYEKVCQYNWRTSHKKNKIYIVTGQARNHTLMYLHNYLMNYTPIPQQEVDHIDGNSCNNRKSNLRIVSRQSNIDNTKVRIDNQIGIRGISYSQRDKTYKCDFCYHTQRYYFKPWKTCGEAVYCRKCAEDYFKLETLAKNPLAEQYLNMLTEEQKQNIQVYVYDKISRKGR